MHVVGRIFRDMMLASGICLVLTAAGAGVAAGQPAMITPPPGGTAGTVAPAGQFNIWNFLRTEQDKTVAPPPANGSTSTQFVPSICTGLYPPPGCQTSVSKYTPDQKNWYLQDNGG